MAKLVYGLWLLCALVIQVYSLEIVNGFENTREIESDAEVRFLFNGLANKCRAKLQATSAVLPLVPVALKRLSNNRLYFFSPAPVAFRVTFDNANQFCKDHGMNLVTINSERENELVFTEAVARGLAGLTGTGAWIGLRDSTLNGVYKWVLNGKGNTFNFFNAVPAAALCIQYRTTTASAASNSWFAANCDAPPLPFICELEGPCSAIL